MHYPTISVGSLDVSLQNIGLIALVIQYAVFGVGFLIDRAAIRIMTVKEDISVFRNVIHWLLAPPTLLCYSFIAFYAIVRFIFNGKKMARHDMAAKDGLGANTVAVVAAVEERKASRSTSLSKEVRNSADGRSSASKKPVPNNSGTLCQLPERFYFGEYSALVSECRRPQNRNNSV